MLEWFWRVVPYPFPPGQKDEEGGGREQGLKNVGDDGVAVVEEGGVLQIGGGIDHGVGEAEKMNRGDNASEC